MQKKHRLIAALLALSMTYWNVIGVSATVSPTYGTVTNSTATFYLCSDVSCPSISILIPSGVMATSSSVTQMAQDRIKQFGDILRNTTQNSISWTTSGSTISDFALIQGTQQTSLNSVTVPFYVNTYASDSDKLNSGFSTNTNGIMMRSTIYGILAGVADTTNTSNYTQIESAVSYYSSLYVTYSTSSSTISAIDNPTKKRLYDNVFGFINGLVNTTSNSVLSAKNIIISRDYAAIVSSYGDPTTGRNAANLTLSNDISNLNSAINTQLDNTSVSSLSSRILPSLASQDAKDTINGYGTVDTSGYPISYGSLPLDVSNNGHSVITNARSGIFEKSSTGTISMSGYILSSTLRGALVSQSSALQSAISTVINNRAQEISATSSGSTSYLYINTSSGTTSGNNATLGTISSDSGTTSTTGLSFSGLTQAGTGTTSSGSTNSSTAVDISVTDADAMIFVNQIKTNLGNMSGTSKLVTRRDIGAMFALNTQASKSMIPILQSSIIPQIQSIANGTGSGYIDFSQQYRTNSIPAFLAAGSGTIANVSNVTVPNSTSNVYGAFQAENINFAKNLVNDFSVTEDTILPITGKLINTDAYKNSDVGIYAKTTNVNGVNSSTGSTTVKGLKSFSFAFSPVTQPIQNDGIIQPSETGKEIGFAFGPFSTYYLTSGYSGFKQFFPGGNDMIVTVRAIGGSAASVKIRIVDPTTSVSSAVALANRETIRTTNGTVSNRDMSRTPETATPALFVNGGITK